MYFSFLIKLLLAVGLMVGSGALHGLLSNRWGPSQDSMEAANRLNKLPKQFGPWRLSEEMELNEPTVRLLQCAGYHHAVYVNEETEEVVNIALLLGPSGPISVHTPEICYAANDYQITIPRQATTIGEEQFWQLTLRSNRVDAHRLRVYYAWGFGGAWQAASTPRVHFAMRPFLYKIQVVAMLTSEEADSQGRDAGRRFLDRFVSAAKVCLAE